jgi:D-arginine dehydrogenase
MHPHDAFADDMVLAEGIDRYSKMVNHEITSLQTSWAGLRTFSQDHALVIGFDKSTKDFFWFAGQGGYGFQTAPAASQLASELILSNSTSLAKGTVKALSPKRFD